jgi:hypothetical protein
MATPLLTTGTVNEVRARVIGDIGGSGISRFRFIRNDAGVTTVADCNAAGAAVRALLATTTWWPSAITWSIDPAVEMFDIGSALVAGTLTMTTVPASITGTGASTFPAGVGARLNWKTATVSGRRMLKGSSYLVPMATASYASNGGVQASITTALTTAGTNYIAAMTAANLVAVIWHRPPKHTTSGGLVGPITGLSVPLTPAGLRSRRS